jgi:hypothetical protein
MTTVFSFFFFFLFTSYVWFYVQYKYEREKKNKREVSREKRRGIERENGQLLLFDGQSIDDKDYAIILFIVFSSDACLSPRSFIPHSKISSFFEVLLSDIQSEFNGG